VVALPSPGKAVMQLMPLARPAREPVVGRARAAWTVRVAPQVRVALLARRP
jgi:hypothetical protein